VGNVWLIRPATRQRVMYAARGFAFGPNVHDGKFIKRYNLTVCGTCYAAMGSNSRLTRCPSSSNVNDRWPAHSACNPRCTSPSAERHGAADAGSGSVRKRCLRFERSRGYYCRRMHDRHRPSSPWPSTWFGASIRERPQDHGGPRIPGHRREIPVALPLKAFNPKATLGEVSARFRRHRLGMRGACSESNPVPGLTRRVLGHYTDDKERARSAAV
jgi:hypothetical protein